MFNFNSAITSLRTHTDKLKVKVREGVNLNGLHSDQILEFSTRLKSNVLQKSAWLQSTVTQKLEPYLLNGVSPPDERTVNANPYNTDATTNPYNFSHSVIESRSLSSYFRPKMSLGETENLEEKRNLNQRRGRRRKKSNSIHHQHQPSKTWIEMDKKNNPGRRNEVGTDSQLSSSSSDEEDIAERFDRVIRIGSDGPTPLPNRRSDRDEIRRRLALESEDSGDKVGGGGRKPSLHSRLQSSMNLQICFMNETASDSESPGSDTEAQNSQQPASLPCIKAGNGGAGTVIKPIPAPSDPLEDFCAKQTRLQAEARQALSQAKEMARLQMTQEKERRLQSPITEMVRNSLKKVGMSLPPERRRVSRQLLTEMNVTQLQVIVNDLHTHIEGLNESLVSMLLERDDLHMEQDSMLVDIEDLTRYLAAKDNSPQSLPLINSGKSILGKK